MTPISILPWRLSPLGSEQRVWDLKVFKSAGCGLIFKNTFSRMGQVFGLLMGVEKAGLHFFPL